jgi:F0F1-type ATP synthase assembly protein I
MSFGAFIVLSFTLCLQFVLRIAFVTLLGYYIDRFIGTFPWVMIVFIMLGGCMGWRVLANVNIQKGPNA